MIMTKEERIQNKLNEIIDYHTSMKSYSPLELERLCRVWRRTAELSIQVEMMLEYEEKRLNKPFLKIINKILDRLEF